MTAPLRAQARAGENLAQTTLLTDANQFFIKRLQVFNWGTFSNIHDIPISQKGFLFVGASGSGKSTLLDAMVTLLYPNPNYNAAAREGDQRRGDRTILSYVRGAWSTQTEADGSGASRTVTQYLRPKATFSAIALTFGDLTGVEVTLMLVAAIKKSVNDESGVRKRYYILEGGYDFNAEDFEGFARSAFDWRWLKKTLPAGEAYDTFTAYSDAFCRLFGIRDKTALKLLAKAQSVKNLGDLNQFLRTFMLEEPETIELANRLVEEFTDLAEAHEAVVTERKKAELLTRGKAQWEARGLALEKAQRLSREAAAVAWWRWRTECALLEADRPAAVKRLDEAERKLTVACEKEAAALALVDELKRRHYMSGGERIEHLKTESRRTQTQLEQTTKRRAHVEAQTTVLGEPIPTSLRGWLELADRMRVFIDESSALAQKRRDERDELVAKRRELEKEFTETAAEVRAMRERPSNIPAKNLAMRTALAQALSLPEEALPFAGELIEVKKAEARWQGAIERVLHNFALSILVADENYEAFSELVERENLGGRLVYLRVRKAKPLLEGFRPRSIPSKLNLAGGPWTNWLENELDRRFSYLCADNMDEFRRADQAVTVMGQVKHSAERHEKDDRSSVSDRRRWVTGFSNAEKLALFEETAAKLAAAIEETKKAIGALEAQAGDLAKKEAAAQFVINCDWQEIDVDSLRTKARGIEKDLAALLEANVELKALEEEIAKAQAEYGKRRELTGAAQSSADRMRDALGDLEGKLKDAEKELEKLADAAEPPDDETAAAVEARAHAFAEGVRLSTLDRCRSSVQISISNEENAAKSAAFAAETNLIAVFEEFLKNWPAYESELRATVEYAKDFMALLERIEADGLPRHEKRFRELLERQSLQNFADLNMELKRARQNILERMEVVNASLEDAPFSRLAEGTSHLRIEVKDTRQPDAEEFRTAMGELIEGAWSDLDAEQAETRFAKAQDIVKKLDPSNRDYVRWRELVLDVRNQMSFTAYELDQNGNVIETYLSGSGKSGGQRQKLTTTCLAAALRYQLGNSEEGLPAFAPVILDEAFDKADSEFTDISMNIFRRFNFQMIVATPEKSIMTLEPYIGGAFYVVMRDRRYSSGVSVAYDEEKERLEIERVASGEYAAEAAPAFDSEEAPHAPDKVARTHEADRPKAALLEPQPEPVVPSLFE